MARHHHALAGAFWALLVLAARTGLGAELTFDFATDKPGQAPAGFRSVLAGSGAPGEWQIVLDDVPSLLSPFTPTAAATGKRPVLAQQSKDPTDERFPILIYEAETFGDFTLNTRFKLVDGAKEQMAGIAFRFVDERNYYYIRASGLGNTFYFFKVINGVRSAPVGNAIPIARGTWHDLTIECQGTRIRALLNGKEALPWLDDKSLSAGQIGFWTKSDSVSYFSDTKIVYKPRETLAQILVREAMRKYPRLLGVKIYASATNGAPMRTIASTEAEEVGKTAPDEADRVLSERGYFYGRGEGVVSLTMPLHDSNGEKVAAVRVLMRSFVGQTENNAVVRVTPVVKSMEARIQSVRDLLQ
jgi:hypothetical protein